ncbi:hypothetical protein FGIG_00018 [Fasciola gigantica]|uniref:Transmembrane protein 42 n=1 Tax=Fasciola gigantica TaxID=46835 RepID=A0A504YJU3_FASGI|nr:hypothetical protein FGIG_00018 [Fasciola gigantica]
MEIEQYRYELSFLSGLLAASAALWAKSMPVYSAWLISWFDSTIALISGYLIYLLINLCMWFVFSLALRSNQKCITTLALNLLSNFGFSALFGWFVFGESLSLRWCVGMFSLSFGTIALALDQ